MLESEVRDVSGYTGQFRSKVLQADGAELEIQHGAIVVATGAQQITPHEYLYRSHPRVLTQRELEERLADPAFVNSLAGQSITMIQCVGSRDESHPYCSRICCTEALKNALEIKRLAPDARVVVLYRDLRSYGFREALYRQARQAGVIFLEYDTDNKPNVASTGSEKLKLTVAIQPENEVIELNPDWLVLSAGIEPEPDNSTMARLLKVR